MKKIDFQSFVM